MLTPIAAIRRAEAATGVFAPTRVARAIGAAERASGGRRRRQPRRRRPKVNHFRGSKSQAGFHPDPSTKEEQAGSICAGGLRAVNRRSLGAGGKIL